MFTNMYHGLRRAVGRHEEDDRAAARDPYRAAQGRSIPTPIAREGAEEAQSADRPAGRARASRDRPEGALYRREGLVLRRHDRGGEPAADRLPGEARDAAAVRLSPSMAAGRHRAVGQPLHHAHRARRLRRKARSAISSAPPSRARRRATTCNEAHRLPEGPRCDGPRAGLAARHRPRPRRLSRQADPHGHSLRAGRHDRPAGARGRPAHAGDLGPAGRRRQSRRRQRRGGGRDRRQVGTRRLHALHGGDGPRHQSADLQEAAVRRRQRLHADQPARDLRRSSCWCIRRCR